jgi:large subunit ribosomal protein L6
MLGVGYRAAVAGNNLTLNVGYSNPVQMTIPQGLTVSRQAVP